MGSEKLLGAANLYVEIEFLLIGCQDAFNLRHSFVTRLVREGLDVATITKLVGNSPKMIFDHYLSANTNLELSEF